eukprot:GEMP01059914.1.p3 GENE.GEMP01059914.1~~GEMP01059914.1.p3  ORF type:complete len:181 (+),score=42.13 GEMP01059914.1:33-545(+)
MIRKMLEAAADADHDACKKWTVKHGHDAGKKWTEKHDHGAGKKWTGKHGHDTSKEWTGTKRDRSSGDDNVGWKRARQSTGPDWGPWAEFPRQEYWRKQNSTGWWERRRNAGPPDDYVPMHVVEPMPPVVDPMPAVYYAVEEVTPAPPPVALARAPPVLLENETLVVEPEL